MSCEQRNLSDDFASVTLSLCEANNYFSFWDQMEAISSDCKLQSIIRNILWLNIFKGTVKLFTMTEPYKKLFIIFCPTLRYCPGRME
jgi:hypothetical protein